MEPNKISLEQIMAAIDGGIVPNFKKDLTEYWKNRNSFSLHAVKSRLVKTIDDLFLQISLPQSPPWQV